jgi:hypothetical protein
MNIEEEVEKCVAGLTLVNRYSGREYEIGELPGRKGQVYNLTITVTRVGEPTMHQLLVAAEAK